jgi:CheY-like chemotaxis protein
MLGMKKVVLASGLTALFEDKGSFLDRADIEVFTAATNGELLRIHKDEHVDLIVTTIDLPGARIEDLFSAIRNDDDLRKVSTIIICKDTLTHRDRCKQCRANAVFPMPVDTAVLALKAQQFLNVLPRKLYRAPLAVGIQGRFRDRPLPFRTENISAGGMLIRTEEPLAKGDGIFFSFFLPDGTHISGYGEIARVEQSETGAYHFGIKFTNVSPADSSAIEEAIKKIRS